MAFITFPSLVLSIRPTSNVLTNTFRMSIILWTLFLIKSKQRIKSSFNIAGNPRGRMRRDKMRGKLRRHSYNKISIMHTIYLLLIVKVFPLHLLKNSEKWSKKAVNVTSIVGTCCFEDHECSKQRTCFT